MSITLPQDLEQRVRDCAAYAGYSTPDECVQDILQEYFSVESSENEEIRQALAESDGQIERGETMSLAEFERRMRARLDIPR